MEASLQGKVAIVVGASRGIGAAVARGFARAGAAVVLAARDEAALEGLAEELTAVGARTLVVPTDVTDADADAVARLSEQAMATFGRLDIACNNAGASDPPTPLAEIPIEDFDAAFAVNLRGVFLAMKCEIPAMVDSGGGAIVNMSSTAGQQAVGGKMLISARLPRRQAGRRQARRVPSTGPRTRPSATGAQARPPLPVPTAAHPRRRTSHRHPHAGGSSAGAGVPRARTRWPSAAASCSAAIPGLDTVPYWTNRDAVETNSGVSGRPGRRGPGLRRVVDARATCSTVQIRATPSCRDGRRCSRPAGRHRPTRRPSPRRPPRPSTPSPSSSTRDPPFSAVRGYLLTASHAVRAAKAAEARGLGGVAVWDLGRR